MTATVLVPLFAVSLVLTGPVIGQARVPDACAGCEGGTRSDDGPALLRQHTQQGPCQTDLADAFRVHTRLPDQRLRFGRQFFLRQLRPELPHNFYRAAAMNDFEKSLRIEIVLRGPLAPVPFHTVPRIDEHPVEVE